ncbi:diguanylate cyclase [uncultured Sphingomonas sp.]|uniref:sensor domain-containing diguanylate cyclase n=1 Tax=uncultured Sphingomonas sp. TaxID=158754 RepID=UPI0035C9A10D
MTAFLFGVVFTSPAQATQLLLHPCITRAAPDMTARGLFARPNLFDCTTPQVRFGSGDFWLLSEPLPRGATTDDVVSMASGWQDAVALYVLRADGSIGSVGITSRTVGPHLRLGPVVVLPIPPGSSRPMRLLWHEHGAANLRGVLRRPMIGTENQVASREIRLSGFFGAFAGMAITMLIGNLALWRALRQAFQPAYCMLLLCIIGYAATSSGALGEWLPQLDDHYRMRLATLFLGASGAAMIFFVRGFFERPVFAGWLDRVSLSVAACVMGAETLCAFLIPWHAQLLDHLGLGAFILLMLLFPMIGWRAWRERSRYFWLFAVTWAVPIGFAWIRIGKMLAIVDGGFFIENATIIAMGLEAALSGLAIAYRIYLLSCERDQARARELVALQLAEIDPLTGLLNRRAFLSRAIGRPGEHMLLLADIDHFKTVNDTIGHDGGDEVLRVFARALRAATPADALVSRFGGEEFAIVVGADTDIAASDILDRLRQERMPFDLRVTASIGTCVGMLSRESDWNALYRSADRALFDAKASGRDRTRAAPTRAAA